MITLTKLSETNTTITLGWTPVPGCTGYRFSAELQAKPSHTWDATLAQVKFKKGSAWYKVEALGVADVGNYPSVSPPPVGTPLEHFSDFDCIWKTPPYGPQVFARRWQQPAPVVGNGLQPLNLDQAGAQPWPDGSGIFEVVTPHGRGFRFVHNDQVSRGSGAGVKIFDVDHILPFADQLGRTVDLTGHIMYPAAGNPNGFPLFADWNNLFEWSDGSTGVYRRLGVNAYGRTFYGIRFDPANPTNPNGFKYTGPVVDFDRWYKWRWRIKFAKDSSGSWDWWVDNVNYGSFSGPTVRDIEGAQFCEFGWYGGNAAGNNEVQHGGLSRSS